MAREQVAFGNMLGAGKNKDTMNEKPNAKRTTVSVGFPEELVARANRVAIGLKKKPQYRYMSTKTPDVIRMLTSLAIELSERELFADEEAEDGDCAAEPEQPDA